MLQLHGKETPERVAAVRARFGLPVMKALPIETRADLSPIRLYAKVADRLLFDARAPREATRPGGLGKTVRLALLENLDPAFRSCCRAGSTPATSPRRCASRARRRSMCPPASSARPARRTRRRSAPSSAPRALADIALAAKLASTRMTASQQPNSFRTGPDERGHFGIYGGRFVAETLMPLILDLEKAYAAAKADPAFKREMDGHLKNYVGRPSPLYFAERLTAHFGGAKIYFKREDLNHTGAHKVNNVLGQIMLAKRMGKPRVIAETGAGMHGVATATLCAKFGLECVVYMGAVDVERQQPNVMRMRALGAEVRPVESGAKTLKDAMNEALRDWVTNVANTFYCIGTVAGPHPYPMMVRDFQCVIGDETRAQMQEAEGRLPDSLIACIGGGSNAMGLFHPFLDDRSVEIYGVEAAGHGLEQGSTRRRSPAAGPACCTATARIC